MYIKYNTFDKSYLFLENSISIEKYNNTYIQNPTLDFSDRGNISYDKLLLRNI